MVDEVFLWLCHHRRHGRQCSVTYAFSLPCYLCILISQFLVHSLCSVTCAFSVLGYLCILIARLLVHYRLLVHSGGTWPRGV